MNIEKAEKTVELMEEREWLQNTINQINWGLDNNQIFIVLKDSYYPRKKDAEIYIRFEKELIDFILKYYENKLAKIDQELENL